MKTQGKPINYLEFVIIWIKSFRIIPNFVFKTNTDTFIANKIETAQDPAGVWLGSPFEKGYLGKLFVLHWIGLRLTKVQIFFSQHGFPG